MQCHVALARKCRPKLISDSNIADSFEKIVWSPKIQDVPAPLSDLQILHCRSNSARRSVRSPHACASRLRRRCRRNSIPRSDAASRIYAARTPVKRFAAGRTQAPEVSAEANRNEIGQPSTTLQTTISRDAGGVIRDLFWCPNCDGMEPTCGKIALAAVWKETLTHFCSEFQNGTVTEGFDRLANRIFLVFDYPGTLALNHERQSVRK